MFRTALRPLSTSSTVGLFMRMTVLGHSISPSYNLQTRQMSSSGAKVWDLWPKELPTCKESRQYEEYKDLTAPEMVKEVSSDIRARAIERVTEALKGDVEGVAVVMMGGKGSGFEFYCADTEVVEFRQEAFFRHLFAVNEPDCFGVLDLAKKESVLYVPQLPESAVRWQGPARSAAYYCDTYGVDETKFASELAQDLVTRGVKKILVLKGLNTDSGAMTKTTAVFEGMEQFAVDEETLHPVLVELRVIKTPLEVALLRKACRMSAQAHTYVMRHIKPGMTELQCEVLFKAYTGYFGGARYMAYTCICGAGHNGSVLHYGHSGYPNSKMLCKGDMIVLDMGAEYVGYATDLTRSYPVDGTFTPRQRAIHAAVCEAQQVVYGMLRAGVEWKDCHVAAERVVVRHLMALGLLINGTEEELCNNYLASVFMPHGLGHLLGMNVHDVGGYVAGVQREKTPGLNWLRLGRKLEAGMVVTVEPGIYFTEPWIEAALKDEVFSKYINAEEVRKWYDFGGVRMEDDILITEDGYENLAGEWPTTADEIEAVMRGN